MHTKNITVRKQFDTSGNLVTIFHLDVKIIITLLLQVMHVFVLPMHHAAR